MAYECHADSSLAPFGRKVRNSLWLIGAAVAASLLLPPPIALAQEASGRIVKGTIPDTLNEIAQSSPGQKAGDVSLVTRNHNLKELALELSRIYLTLYNSKRLSVKSVETSEHTVEAVLRKERLFYGKFFPTEIDSMICDLNSDICNRERTEATGEQRQSLTSNVSGFLPSETRWRLEPPVNKLWVPDVVLVKDTGWLPYDVMPKTQLAPLVIDELGGCEKFDETCQKLIIFYNPSLGGRVFQTSSKGRLVLPVLTIKVSTNVANASEAIKPDSLEPTIKSNSLELQKIDAPAGRDSYKVIYNDVISKQVPTPLPLPPQPPLPDQVVKELQRNILPGISIKIFDVQPGAAVLPMDVQNSRTQLNQLISWPTLLSQLPYPAEFQGGVGVGVLDSRVDDQHCGLDYSKVTISNRSPAPILGARANCNLQVPGTEEVDHGTHVVGIIGGFYPQPGSRLPIGLNPYAQIATMEIDFVHPSSDQIASDMKLMVQERLLKVINMSFGYLMTAQNPDLQLTDALESPIAALSNATLFVAAAGNAGINKSYLCDIRPACFDLPNVIAVAGLDRNAIEPSFLDSDQRPHSNFGNRIHVAAIGQAVFSTLANGRLGYLTGTSQAAPQVSALASLMFAKYSGVMPIEVKNRLIYCSDMMQSLEEKLFSGGRINADCALDGDAGRLTLKVGGVLQKGKLDLRAILNLTDADNSDVNIPVQTLRALHYNAWNDSYTVFYNARNNRDSTLFRLSGLTFKDPNKSIAFTPAGGHVASINVGQIGKFVSSMK
ncbi:S8 family serine peptidase [Bradyrhizobium sp. KBS0727]|uniref:S8 family serine peptidase n=1 Tax=unclassified Bradyrhizobium TaxID=2631580 RepID=UPI00110F4911|nr:MULTISPECIES: S8 family serine peptidase [unclassified Bradyrhizobium]QDW35833.1 S8 family serine peptidase [Bradyrhizobium sp. KBS0725]QDW42433.1 S8 family serine peptidase [Bradyrhizobium sp. KBS0727]